MKRQVCIDKVKIGQKFMVNYGYLMFTYEKTSCEISTIVGTHTTRRNTDFGTVVIDTTPAKPVAKRLT